MSHHHERADKECLNCHAQVIGRFCHVCGQENIETKESFWTLTSHFVYDLLHFDGQFFHTLGALFRRPGFVAREYVAGKRASYLHPIRMYLFTSAVFFLLFFSLNKSHPNERSSTAVQLTQEDRRKMAAELQAAVGHTAADSALQGMIAELRDTTKRLSLESIGRINDYTTSTGVRGRYVSQEKYDSVQHALPPAKRDGWLTRRIMAMNFTFNPAYNGTKGIDTLKEMIVHRLPYMLFVSLPFFALLLKLLYVRRKNFYYSDHAVFTLYHYILSFVLLLLFFGSSGLHTLTGWRVFSILRSLFLLAWPVYLFIEMKKFYGQGYLKTFGKFILLNFLASLVLGILFFIFSVISAFQV
ncbi:MAG: DUF3667 domain-containing protein [Williamsia sp.]|nr:DUF3667 domain-containing protein [Williamsia sp.]